MRVHFDAWVIGAVAVVGGLFAPTAARPNFIVMQPDDLEHFEAWNPPAHFSNRYVVDYPSDSDLPNINRLREDGVQFTQAYTASSMCGTSRYSTMTGRYPSRSARSRQTNSRNGGTDVSVVTIPVTKIQENNRVDDGFDCSIGNSAALFQANDYATGVVGKWHLANDNGDYDYGRTQESIRDCGFDFAEAIYHENLGDWAGPGVTHNMEHVTAKAIQFIEKAILIDEEPFYLYLNPTVPHGSGDVTDALESADCKNTVEGILPEEPYIPFGMTADYADCRAYRQSVLDRVPEGGDGLAGSIWIDDAIGSIILTLEALGELDNTFFLFQQDHGQEGKSSLYETGIRIAQWVHFPSKFQPGTTFDGVVSTIDIVPTMMELAGIGPSSTGYYEMDGRSWRSEVEAQNSEWSQDACVYTELDKDRAVVCGCHKYVQLYDASDVTIGTLGTANSEGFTLVEENYFYLCDPSSGEYLTGTSPNPEQDGTISAGDQEVADELKAILECYLRYTDPSVTPDYDIQCTNTLRTVSDPASSSTPGPTPGPTPAPTPGPTPAPQQQAACSSACTKRGNIGIVMHSMDTRDGTCTPRCLDESEREDRENSGWVCGECPDDLVLI